jgi:hypothetical protein
MSALHRRVSGKGSLMSKPLGKYIRRDIVHKSSQTPVLRCHGRIHPAKLLRLMTVSHSPVIKAIMKDDVSAFAGWGLEHPDFVVEFDGHNESALTWHL